MALAHNRFAALAAVLFFCGVAQRVADDDAPVPLRLALAEESNSSNSKIDAAFDSEFNEDDIAEVMKEVTESREPSATTTSSPSPLANLANSIRFGRLHKALAAVRPVAAAMPHSTLATVMDPQRRPQRPVARASVAIAEPQHLPQPALRKPAAAVARTRAAVAVPNRRPRAASRKSAVAVAPVVVVNHPAPAVAATATNNGNAIQPRLRGQVASAENSSGLPDLIILGGSSPSSSLEDQISDLFKLGAMRKSMGKAAFEATPFGSSIKKIQQLIENTMMPKVLTAHDTNQKQLVRLAREVQKCGSTKNGAVARANIKKASYMRLSPLHMTCRAGEGGLASERSVCNEELRDKSKIRDLKCKEFAMVKKKFGDENMNRQIVKKAGSESVEVYITRITNTVCGTMNCAQKHAKNGGCGRGGMLDFFMISKRECERVTTEFDNQRKKCRNLDREYKDKVKECDSLQDQMDGSACKRAMGMKDACETYAECYFGKRKAFHSSQKMVKQEEADRKVEWRGLKRMQCLIGSFADGKVQQTEVTACKKKAHSTKHLDIKHPRLPPLVKCSVPNLYPATPSYKKKEFAPLPILAKGRDDANQCTGVQEIDTKPMKGSPKMCKCQRVTLNGPYSGGPLVKCTNCWDVSRSQQQNSCPEGTKLFSPRSRSDWKSVLASVKPTRAPHWIIDITRAGDGCGGCTSPMNSRTALQKTWVTSDGSPWWLRSQTYREPSGNYLANCYMAVVQAKNTNKITMKSDKCDIHSHSYLCQNKEVSLTPKRGSPRSCTCKQVVLTGKYSAGALLKCIGCIAVSKSLQKNSCPVGTKLFSPRSRSDWRTFIASAKPLRSPHFIIDVTRPQNGCGGCTRSSMNFRVPEQATWRTADASPWWLRSTRYSEPSGDYRANCYMDIWQSPPNEDSVTFNDAKCKYHSNSYYCQPAAVKKKQLPPSPPPAPPAGPPSPKKGGSYKGYRCAAAGKYTGLSKKCDAFKSLTESQCWAKCKKSAPAQDKKSCNKVHGIPDCVAMVWNAETKTCNLYRSCAKLVKARSAERTKIKANYRPAATVFMTKKNARCKGKPYTEGPKGCQGPRGITEKQCSALCYGNRYVGKNCPVRRCVAAAFYAKDGRCELYDKCSSVSHVVGVTALKKKRIK